MLGDFALLAMAALLVPGAGPAKVGIQYAGRRLIVTASARGWSEAVQMTDKLRPVR